MLYVKKHFTVVRLSDALDLHASGERPALPMLSITFDDGFQAVRDIAFPVLQELELPATVFLVTGLTDTDETVWYCALNQAFSEAKTQSLVWKDRRYDLRSRAGRAHACRTLQAALKKMPQPALAREVRDVIASLGHGSGVRVSKMSPFRILDSRSIREMQKSGLIEFGAHTHTHSILGLLPEDVQEREIRWSIDRVAALTGKACTLFSYPNGEQRDFGESTRSLLVKYHIRCSVTMMRGPNYPGTDPFSYHRYGIENNMSFQRFIMNVHHMVWVKRSISGARRPVPGREILHGC